MMAIMCATCTLLCFIIANTCHRIPVYIINALYLWPITLWTYLKYGRPTKPQDGNRPAEHAHHQAHATSGATDEEAHAADDKPEAANPNSHHSHNMAGMHHGDSNERPMFATITVAVCHCGAGCVLGDLVGEWLVFGTNVAINGRGLWPEFLIGTICFIPT
jgi:hypothetical protein